MKTLSLAAMVMLASGIARAKDPELPAELKWVPANSVAFAHVRLAELWDSREGKALSSFLEVLEPKMFAEVEHQLGLPLKEIQSLTAVVPDIQAGEDFGLVLRIVAREPFDRTKVAERLGIQDRPDRPKGLGGRKALYTRERPYGPRGYIQFNDARTITMFYGSGAAGLVDRMFAESFDLPLAPALQAAASGDHLVIAVDAMRLGELPPGAYPIDFAALLHCGVATVRGKLKAGSLDLTMHAAVHDATHRRDAMHVLAEHRKSWAEMFQPEAKPLGPTPDAAIIARIYETVIAAIKGMKVELAEGGLSGTAKWEPTELVAAIEKNGLEMAKLSNERRTSINNLRHLTLGMHNYASAFTVLPGAAICDRDGKPLLSWRVAILPYLEFDNLYREFRLDEPWDSDHNIKLAARMPEVYRTTNEATNRKIPATHYRVFVGNDAAFNLKNGRTLEEIAGKGGLSRTALIVTAADAVPWTKPEELDYDPKAAPKLGFLTGDVCDVAMADGMVRAFPKSMKPEVWHDLIQVSSPKQLISRILFGDKPR